MYDKDLLHKVGNAKEKWYCSSLINSHFACDTIQEQMRFLFAKHAFFYSQNMRFIYFLKSQPKQ